MVCMIVMGVIFFRIIFLFDVFNEDQKIFFQRLVSVLDDDVTFSFEGEILRFVGQFGCVFFRNSSGFFLSSINLIYILKFNVDEVRGRRGNFERCQFVSFQNEAVKDFYNDVYNIMFVLYLLGGDKNVLDYRIKVRDLWDGYM